MQNTVVSVIIPIYNVENYVASAIESVLHQSYRNLEIICVNDGSTDKSADIANHLLSSDVRAQIINQSNAGLSAARNAGLDCARGDYVFFLDSDDLISSETIEELVRESIQSSSDIVVSSYGSFFSENEWIEFKRKRVFNGFKHLTINDFYYQIVSNHSWAKLYKRSLFEDNAIRFPVGRTYEDVATTYKLMQNANHISYSEYPFYFYRQNLSGISRTFSLKNVEDFYASYREVQISMQGLGMSDAQLFYVLSILYSLIRLVNNLDLTEESLAIRKELEAEFNNLFDYRAINISKNLIMSIKLLLRRTGFGKRILTCLKK